ILSPPLLTWDEQWGNAHRQQRWERSQRAERWTRDGTLTAQGRSQRQAAKGLDVPRSPLQAWQPYHESRDDSPAVGALFHSVPGLACLHRLVLASHLACGEVGACGMRLVSLLWHLTGLQRLVGASYGTPHQVKRRVAEASVAYRHAERPRLAPTMPPTDSTRTQAATVTGGLCLGG